MAYIVTKNIIDTKDNNRFMKSMTYTRALISLYQAPGIAELVGKAV